MKKLLTGILLILLSISLAGQVNVSSWYSTGGGAAPDCGTGTDDYGDTGASYATNTLNDDIVWYCSVDVTTCGYVTSVNAYVGATASTAAKVAIYTDVAGEPGSIIANGISDELTTMTTGGYNAFVFTTDPFVESGTTYWIGILSDDDFKCWRSGSETVYFESGNPYASGFPTTATPASTSGKGTGVYITVDHDG